MPYMVTFTINIPQMLAYIPYMDPMGLCGVLVSRPVPPGSSSSASSSAASFTYHCHTPSFTHHLSHHLCHTPSSTIFHNIPHTHNFVTHQLSHIFVTHRLSDTIFHTPLCHAPLCHTPSLSHTIFHTQHITLLQTIFHAQLCHTHTHTLVTHHVSHTHNLDTRHLSHTHSFVTHTQPFTHNISHTTLSHTIFLKQLCHTQLFTNTFLIS